VPSSGYFYLLLGFPSLKVIPHLQFAIFEMLAPALPSVGKSIGSPPTTKN